MEVLNRQLSVYKNYLINKVEISVEHVERIGTIIEEEVSMLKQNQIEKIKKHSPVELKNRYEELLAFQRMMDYIRLNDIKEPGLIRSQVITQNYISFVYLKDSFFRALKNETPEDTVIYKCCDFLTSGRVRKLRNSIAHGNWNYLSCFTGIEFWDYLSGKEKNGYEKFEIKQEELGFLQTLSRGVAYASIEALTRKN